jgi:hypothetical protein
MTASVSTSNTPSGQWIDADPMDFRNNFNRKTFELRHELSDHPLLQLSKLAGLAERTLAARPTDLHYNMGSFSVDQSWIQKGPRPFTALEAFERIENSGAWFVLYKAEKDPEYRELLDHGLGAIKAMIGNHIESKISKQEIIVFVTSPNRITPYHIDRECNFLFQIRGTKTVHVFDGRDKEVISDEEIERFWVWGWNHQQPPYRKDLQNRATSYRFSPGMGAHIPVNHPHWVENDNNVSISLSMNFIFKDRYRANIYRANHCLRLLGLRPTAPGRNPIIDYTKGVVGKPLLHGAEGISKLRKLAHV